VLNDENVFYSIFYIRLFIFYNNIYIYVYIIVVYAITRDGICVITVYTHTHIYIYIYIFRYSYLNIFRSLAYGRMPERETLYAYYYNAYVCVWVYIYILYTNIMIAPRAARDRVIYYFTTHCKPKKKKTVVFNVI